LTFDIKYPIFVGTALLSYSTFDPP